MVAPLLVEFLWLRTDRPIGSFESCWNPKPKAEQEKAKKLDDAKKKAFASTTKSDPNSIGSRMSRAREAVYGKKSG